MKSSKDIFFLNLNHDGEWKILTQKHLKKL